MQKRPKIGIIISTTRPGRFADIPTNWLFNIAKERNDADFEIVDLRDYPMPFFQEKVPLHVAPPQNEVALRWGEKVASLDGYIFVTAEYNHSIPAVLKNALDYLTRSIASRRRSSAMAAAARPAPSSICGISSPRRKWPRSRAPFISV
jgi:NAD(P)H-dependent FMN reductase